VKRGPPSRFQRHSIFICRLEPAAAVKWPLGVEMRQQLPSRGGAHCSPLVTRPPHCSVAILGRAAGPIPETGQSPGGNKSWLWRERLDRGWFCVSWVLRARAPSAGAGVLASCPADVPWLVLGGDTGFSKVRKQGPNRPLVVPWDHKRRGVGLIGANSGVVAARHRPV